MLTGDGDAEATPLYQMRRSFNWELDLKRQVAVFLTIQKPFMVCNAMQIDIVYWNMLLECNIDSVCVPLLFSNIVSFHV